MSGDSVGGGRVTTETTEIRDGIEHFVVRFPDGREEEDAQCARCGSTAYDEPCWRCHGMGWVDEDDDDPEWPRPAGRCEDCDGRGGWWHCCSGRAWCEANPMPGREHITSTARDREER